MRPAVRSDGEQFDIRIALSVSNSIDNPIFSALIDPLYEATVKTDARGKILQASLFFPSFFAPNLKEKKKKKKKKGSWLSLALVWCVSRFVGRAANRGFASTSIGLVCCWRASCHVQKCGWR